MGAFLNRNKLSKAVILCGNQYEGLNPLLENNPICLLPLLNRSFIDHTLEFLKNNNINDIMITISKEDNDSFRECFKTLKQQYSPPEVKINYFVEDSPKGTAGALRDLKGFIGDDTFLVINGNMFIEDFPIYEMLLAHYKGESVITIGVKKNLKHPTEGISVEKDGSVKGFSIIHPSMERRSTFTALDIYIFDPRAIEFVKNNGYFDIKEQLIPAIKKTSLPVRICEIKGNSRRINTIEDYYNLQREMLMQGKFSNGAIKEIAEGVWAGEDVHISQKSYFIGPVIIGSNSKIGDGAQIVGPTIIGNNCKIGERTLVRESIIMNNVETQADSSLKFCITGKDVRIHSGDAFNNRILVDGLRPSDVNLIPSQYEFNSVVETAALKISGFKYMIYLGFKRVMDLILSSLLFILLFPLFLIIAAVIKRDSEGPFLFRQKRCGKDGKDFEMFKFRTMVKDAHSMQQNLASQNIIDGPMFKIINDPRITKVGHFLRKTSLDELPQIVNVIKGEMSLVGPRPLVMDEMRFSPSWRSIRLKVKPGITGLWQVDGRSEAPFHEWIRHDLYYVKNQCILLDLKILLKTIGVVFKRVGAH